MATQVPLIVERRRHDRRDAASGEGQGRLRARPRPPSSGTTELVRVIEFLWIGKAGVQPVLMVKRELLH